MSEISNWQKTKNLATGIWNSIGGSRYYKAGIGVEQATMATDIAKGLERVKSGKLTQDEFDKIAPTYKNSLMDSIRTNKNPFHRNTNIGILAGTAAGVGYSYANDDMDNYRRNVFIGGLSGGLVGHLDKVLSGAMHSQGRLSKELSDSNIDEFRTDSFDYDSFLDL